MIPNWLHIVAWISILVGFACAAYTIMDAPPPQHMKNYELRLADLRPIRSCAYYCFLPQSTAG